MAGLCQHRRTGPGLALAFTQPQGSEWRQQKAPETASSWGHTCAHGCRRPPSWLGVWPTVGAPPTRGTPGLGSLAKFGVWMPPKPSGLWRRVYVRRGLHPGLSLGTHGVGGPSWLPLGALAGEGLHTRLSLGVCVGGAGERLAQPGAAAGSSGSWTLGNNHGFNFSPSALGEKPTRLVASP